MKVQLELVFVFVFVFLRYLVEVQLELVFVLVFVFSRYLVEVQLELVGQTSSDLKCDVKLRASAEPLDLTMTSSSFSLSIATFSLQKCSHLYDTKNIIK